MICALLIFQRTELPEPLSRLSPWLDWLGTPRATVYAELAAQRHRRFIKTHTPLDGIPLDPRCTYIVTMRDPLDMAVSLYHQGENLDRGRIRQLLGEPEPEEPPEPRPPLHEWLLSWIGPRTPTRGNSSTRSRGDVALHRRLATAPPIQHRAGALRRPLCRPRRRDAPPGRPARDRCARRGSGPT